MNATAIFKKALKLMGNHFEISAVSDNEGLAGMILK